MVAVMRAPSAVRSTCLMVSMAGVATMAAPCFSMAAMVRVDGGGVDEGADGIVDEDDVLRGGGGEGGEGVGDGFLAVVAAGDDVDFFGEMVLGEHGGDAGLFGVADGDVDGGDGGDVEEGAQRVDEDGEALEGEELLRRTARWRGPCGCRCRRRG